MTAKVIASTADDIEKLRQDIALLERVLQNQVKSFCEDYGTSQRDLARLLGISVQYLSDICHGRRKVSDAIVKKIRGLK